MITYLEPLQTISQLRYRKIKSVDEINLVLVNTETLIDI